MHRKSKFVRRLIVKYYVSNCHTLPSYLIIMIRARNLIHYVSTDVMRMIVKQRYVRNLAYITTSFDNHDTVQQI